MLPANVFRVLTLRVLTLRVQTLRVLTLRARTIRVLAREVYDTVVSLKTLRPV